jgi:hypothetical protein
MKKNGMKRDEKGRKGAKRGEKGRKGEKRDDSPTPALPP